MSGGRGTPFGARCRPRVTLFAATGLFGGYLGNPRIPRAYAAGVQCGVDVTTGAELNDAITAFNTSGPAGCDTVYLSGDVVVDPGGVTNVNATGKDFVPRATPPSWATSPAPTEVSCTRTTTL